MNRPSKCHALSSEPVQVMIEAPLARTDKPILLAVHGFALGAAHGRAIGNDLMVASEIALFGHPERKIGIPAATVFAHRMHLAERKITFGLLTLCDRCLTRPR